MSILDYEEIATGAEFEDLVAAILENTEGIRNVSRTGEGPDFGADITAEVDEQDVLTRPRTRKVVIQCKHYAKSGKSVSAKTEINPLQTLLIHGADIYLLVTSSHVTTTTTAVLNAIQNDPKHRGERAEYWDAPKLEKILLRERHHEIVRRYFRKSSKKIDAEYAASRHAREKTREVAFARRAGLETEDEMVSGTTRGRIKKPRKRLGAYVISSVERRDVLMEESLRRDEKEVGIDLTFSSDILVDWLGSYSESLQHDEKLAAFDAVFALVRETDKHSAAIWFEIEKAYEAGNLKLVLIAEGANTVNARRYPLVVLRRDQRQTLDQFHQLYREHRVDWGETADRWLWLSINLIGAVSRDRRTLRGARR